MNPNMGDPIAVTLYVTGILERLSIPYAIGGSLASAVYGVMRATMDADLVAAMRPEHIAPFVAALGADFYADEQMIGDAVRAAMLHSTSFIWRQYSKWISSLPNLGLSTRLS